MNSGYVGFRLLTYVNLLAFLAGEAVKRRSRVLQRVVKT